MVVLHRRYDRRKCGTIQALLLSTSHLQTCSRRQRKNPYNGTSDSLLRKKRAFTSRGECSPKQSERQQMGGRVGCLLLCSLFYRPFDHFPKPGLGIFHHLAATGHAHRQDARF